MVRLRWPGRWWPWAWSASSVKKAAKELDDRQIPLAGLTAAFIFALQMLNFPVASGTSGHLLGGCLAAVLVGPWVGSLCMAVVFIVQALVFADGGLTALGLNIIMMGYVTCFVGYAVFLLLRKVCPDDQGRGDVAAGRRGLVRRRAGVGRVRRVLRHRRRRATRPSGTVAAAMVGVHVLIGIGEAIITGLTVGAVLAVRPDLVYGARDIRPALAVRRPVSSAGHV